MEFPVSLRNLILLLLFFMLAGFSVYYLDAQSSGGDAALKTNNDLALSGYAWSSNIGWISFCGDPSSSGCASVAPGNEYQAYVDNDSGRFAGHAWSSNIGWISFERSETGNPPDGSASGPLAAVNIGDSEERKITGWARALAACDSVPCSSAGAGSNTGGWNGWIKFSGEAEDGSLYVTEASSSYRLTGWAWGADEIGWVSFGTSSASAERVTAEQPSISVKLTPSSTVRGYVSLRVKLTATVTTSSTRPITYEFNCNNAPTSTITDSGSKVEHVDCFYTVPRHYTPSVRVIQNGVFDSMAAASVLLDGSGIPIEIVAWPAGFREINPGRLPPELPPEFFED